MEAVALEPTFVTRKNCSAASTFVFNGNRTELPSPVLHIETGAYTYVHQNQSQSLYGNDLSNNGICKPSNRFEWGFSFILLFSFMVLTIPLALSLLYVWFVYYNRVWPQQVEMVFGSFRTAMAVTASIRDELGTDADEMANSELEKTLRSRCISIRHKHVRSKIMAKPCPNQRIVVRPKYDYVVGSENYKAYIQHGYDSLS